MRRPWRARARPAENRTRAPPGAGRAHREDPRATRPHQAGGEGRHPGRARREGRDEHARARIVARAEGERQPHAAGRRRAAPPRERGSAEAGVGPPASGARRRRSPPAPPRQPRKPPRPRPSPARERSRGCRRRAEGSQRKRQSSRVGQRVIRERAPEDDRHRRASTTPATTQRAHRRPAALSARCGDRRHGHRLPRDPGDAHHAGAHLPADPVRREPSEPRHERERGPMA